MPDARMAEPLWFLGTLVHVRLGGEQTGGRFSLQEALLPHGAAPPLHSHRQDETFYVLEGTVTFWIVEPGPAQGRAWLDTCAQHCGAGAAVEREQGIVRHSAPPPAAEPKEEQ